MMRAGWHGTQFQRGEKMNTQEYDKEIVDIADYVHNYKIDSDLAV